MGPTETTTEAARIHARSQRVSLLDACAHRHTFIRGWAIFFVPSERRRHPVGPSHVWRVDTPCQQSISQPPSLSLAFFSMRYLHSRWFVVPASLHFDELRFVGFSLRQRYFLSCSVDLSKRASLLFIYLFYTALVFNYSIFKCQVIYFTLVDFFLYAILTFNCFSSFDK